MKRLIWWLLVGTRGGETRAKILKLLKEQPCNANQLTQKLGLDYKTIRHHLHVLQKNKIVVTKGGRYGRLYFLSPEMEKNIHIFKEIWSKIEENKLNRREK